MSQYTFQKEIKIETRDKFAYLFLFSLARKNAIWPWDTWGLANRFNRFAYFALEFSSFFSFFTLSSLYNIIYLISPHAITMYTVEHYATPISYATRIISNIRYGFVSFHYKIQSIKPSNTVKTVMVQRCRSMWKWHVPCMVYMSYMHIYIFFVKHVDIMCYSPSWEEESVYSTEYCAVCTVHVYRICLFLWKKNVFLTQW